MPHIAVLGFRGIPATWGGIEHQCEEIYTRLVKMGYEITIYCRSYYVPSDIKEYKGIKLIRLPTIQTKHADATVHTFLALCHALKEPYDIIHIFGQGPCLFSWIPRFFKPKAYVFFTCTGLDWQRKKWGTFASFSIRLGELFSTLFPHEKIGVSLAIKDYYVRRYGVNMHYVPNGTATPVVRPPKKILEWGLAPGGYFLWVGRIVPEKRVEDIIKAHVTLSSAPPLVIVGDSPDRAYVSQVKSVAKDRGGVMFLGYQFREALEELYSNALAFVTASDLEGLPLTLLEAMSYGIPCVASSIAPHREALGELTEFLFSVGDTAALRRHLEVLSDMGENERRVKGDLFAARANKVFSWDHVAQAYADLYNRVLKKH
ncbi:MAG: glycosyltransferase family 4 protein [Syntrophobacterales bacterium]|nr:glycosyltransferase family 4 protein [Syntrophobacterales bacterium]